MDSIRRVREEAVTPTCVSVPATPHAIDVLRSVTAAVAARSRLGFEQVDDLRLAVSEAAARLISLGRGSTVREEIRIDADTIAVRLVLLDAAITDWPLPDRATPFSRIVIDALVDDASESLQDGDPCIELRLRVPRR